jgi:23S rRNA (guanine2445-N2)-methyltransferase / 23S rRNA (guanine2069-N7)-methyltransferase
VRFFLTTARGCEHILAEELTQIGVETLRVGRGGVGFDGELAVAERVALWTRVGDRLLEQIADLEAADGDSLYASASEFEWGEWIRPGDSFAISVTVAGNARIRDSRWGRHRLKDAIVDQLRSRRGSRPEIDTERPDVRFDLALHADRGTLSIDLVGQPLHRRGIRGRGRAPLRENAAAAMLIRAGWNSDPGPRPLVDPMCGTGTFLVEAAWMAMDVAPGSRRRSWWFERHPEHDADAWAAERERARDREVQGRERWSREGAALVGYDADRDAVADTLGALERAGLSGIVHAERRPLARVEAPPGDTTGLVITNPPWGDRLGQDEDLGALYHAIGATLLERFSGWNAAVLVGERSLGRALGLRADHRHDFLTGGKPVQLLRIEVGPDAQLRPRPTHIGGGVDPSDAPEDLVNRLRKNLKRRRKWAKRAGTDAFRVYDRDLPEFALAIDSYAGHPHMIEHTPPASVDPELAKARLRAAVAAVSAVFDVEPSRIPLKRRHRQRSGAAYDRRDDRGEEIVIREGDARLLANLWDYHDTGVFLDHRPMRRRIAAEASGARFLNLFGYTGTATVHAGIGGAQRTTTVDLSPKYLAWARRNLSLNGLPAADHELIDTDVMAWLQDAPAGGWDFAFVDPPTISKSKRMRGSFDIQRDHVELLHRVRRVVRSGSLVFFSTNFRKFELDPEVEELFEVERIADSIPEDFARSPKIHQAWRLVSRRRR